MKFIRQALPTLMMAAALLASTAAHAQFKNAEHAAKYRQGAFTVMAVHFGNIGAMVNGKKDFDAKQAEVDANAVKALSALPWAGFGPETEYLETKALPEIWLEKDKFLAAATKLQTATSNLAAVAKTGDAAKLKVAFGKTAKSCKACHDAYKE